eukprot:CAMPEP_0119490846 /NCGR_PEP_ID=MMETSP1344-20130328/15893_1 /TAXON_ID=236787 /ORGANISM="Florenciella parvula, Strain CCMP2471" /LENGTH=421 /DNA_ID=CAMNT_0007526043 /DNA_START=285 /DNA_END=1547 /DNA_ORIENTATION=-
MSHMDFLEQPKNQGDGSKPSKAVLLEKDAKVDAAKKMADRTHETVLEVRGFKCPIRYVNDFPPDEFEELVCTFEKFDVDGSKTIDKHEMRKMLADLDMDHTMDKANELMEQIDVDGSGQLDFAEYVEFVARIKRGDSLLRGYAKLTASLNETPMSVLDIQAKKRQLTVGYRLVEERAPTSMHAAYFVMEAVLTGKWFDMVDGAPQQFVGSKRFQGIGKTTRDAKFKSAESALVKLKSMMPGIAYTPGVIPENWMKWVRSNFARGVPEYKLCSMLTTKGFHPARNSGLMQHLIASAELKKELERDEEFMGMNLGHDGDGIVVDTLEAYLDNKLRMGFDGAVLVEVMASFGFPPEKNPSLIQRLRRNEVSAGSQLAPAAIIEAKRPRCRDFFQACEEGSLFEVKLYLHAGMPADASEEVVGGT